MDQSADVIIVGAGAAGLGTAASLQRLGIHPIVLEEGDTVARSWASAYDALHLHTVRRYSGLPLHSMPSSYPRYASRDQLVAYLRDYATRFNIDVRTNCRVTNAEHSDSGWRLTTPADTFECRELVVASGVASSPIIPNFPGMSDYSGTLLHSAKYRNAEAFAGKRMLLIGAGNSGAEIALDLVRGGAQVTVAIREGVNAVPLSLLGMPIQYWGLLVAKMPRAVSAPLASLLLRRSVARLRRAGIPKSPEPVLGGHGIPIIGLGFLDAARQHRIRIVGGIKTFTHDGVEFTDGHAEAFDAIILATGYRPALDFLGDQIRRDGRGFPIRAAGGVQSIDFNDLYFVGYSYSIAGTLNLIRREAPKAAQLMLARQRARTVSAPKSSPLTA